MRRFCISLLLCLGAACHGQIRGGDDVQASGLKRLGINVGSRSRWGAAQFLKNLIGNPGFEAGEYGTVFLASASSSGNKFVDAFANSAQPPGFWNGADGGDPEAGASLRGGIRLGAVSHGRYTHVRTGATYDPQKINLLIGGQAGYAGRQREIEQNSSNHDRIALAPYFGVLDTWSSDEEIFYPLFALALPLYMLLYQRDLGIVYQCAFSSL